jgi:hypothetical protein
LPTFWFSTSSTDDLFIPGILIVSFHATKVTQPDTTSRHWTRLTTSWRRLRELPASRVREEWMTRQHLASEFTAVTEQLSERGLPINATRSNSHQTYKKPTVLKSASAARGSQREVTMITYLHLERRFTPVSLLSTLDAWKKIFQARNN